jgi:hypothetical protein
MTERDRPKITLYKKTNKWKKKIFFVKTLKIYKLLMDVLQNPIVDGTP